LDRREGFSYLILPSGYVLPPTLDGSGHAFSAFDFVITLPGPPGPKRHLPYLTPQQGRK
jgi:hypothetical protein